MVQGQLGQRVLDLKELASGKSLNSPTAPEDDLLTKRCKIFKFRTAQHSGHITKKMWLRMIIKGVWPSDWGAATDLDSLLEVCDKVGVIVMRTKQSFEQSFELNLYFLFMAPWSSPGCKHEDNGSALSTHTTRR